ncbi:MAG: hypothetical protein SFT81_05775, partial [Candidatus Caenarcaniphilales bacterium]|nr:hypothetical protein [Candidatus Caenarcaniphilales bacterium]
DCFNPLAPTREARTLQPSFSNRLQGFNPLAPTREARTFIGKPFRYPVGGFNPLAPTREARTAQPKNHTL